MPARPLICFTTNSIEPPPSHTYARTHSGIDTGKSRIDVRERAHRAIFTLSAFPRPRPISGYPPPSLDSITSSGHRSNAGDSSFRVVLPGCFLIRRRRRQPQIRSATSNGMPELGWLIGSWQIWAALFTALLVYLTNPTRWTAKQNASKDQRPTSGESGIVGRNLLNKKEAGPPSTIKESSESSQTLDDNESDKGSGQLKHENTVVRADGAAKTSPTTAANPAVKHDIIKTTQFLLDTISARDYPSYQRLCDPAMTCFEPETLGTLIEGIDFHRFYFDAPSTSTGQPRKPQLSTTMVNPKVQILGEDAACIAYILLTQFVDRNGEVRTRQSQESRVWHKKAGRWVCVHLHRSGDPLPTCAVDVR